MLICSISIVISVITEGGILFNANISEFENIIVIRIVCINILRHLNINIFVPLDIKLKYFLYFV